MKAYLLILSSTFLVSLSTLAQSKVRINVIGDVAVLNMLHEGRAVDVRNLVAVSTDPLTNPIRIERSIRPNSLDQSIKLIVPTSVCEKLPAYVLYRDHSLYFFLDYSKRSASTASAVCNKFEISYVLNEFNLDSALPGPLRSGLAIPRPKVPRPFEFIDSQNVIPIPVPFQTTGSYNLAIEVDGEKIVRAGLSVTNELGHPVDVIQTLP